MSPELQILLTAVVTAVAAALPGTYLVLRRTALVSDAISHAILPGIVIAFFLTRDLNSPLLLVAAAATGVLTVFLIEALLRSHLVPEDASIGLVFPALFSVGVILISRFGPWAGFWPSTWWRLVSRGKNSSSRPSIQDWRRSSAFPRSHSTIR
jgi:manganese/zinc/iron transport system permease protein